MKLDTQCWFRLNTSKAPPISLMRGNFLAHKSDPDEFALWCRLQAISLVSSCPLIRSRRLGACCLFVCCISVAVQMGGRGTWQPQRCVVDPTWAITLLQWQRDINRMITNLCDVCWLHQCNGKEFQDGLRCVFQQMSWSSDLNQSPELMN